jgi:hypothetical protein
LISKYFVKATDNEDEEDDKEVNEDEGEEGDWGEWGRKATTRRRSSSHRLHPRAPLHRKFAFMIAIPPVANLSRIDTRTFDPD